MRSVKSVCWSAAFVAAVLAGADALAQQTTPLPVTDEDYQALGLRTGAFIAYPSLETGVEASDNVSAAQTNRRSDAGAYVAPALRVESDWARHYLQFRMSSRHLFYFRTPTEDTNEARLRANARIDVASTTAVELDAGYALDQEGRGSVDVPGAAAEPPNTHSFDASGALLHRMGRIATRVAGTFGYNVYEDVDLVGGGTANNSDRNYYESGGELRLGYDLSPRIQPFVEGGYTVRQHEQEIDDDGFRRDSQGYTVAAGVRVEVAHTLTAEASVGYVRRDFEDSAIDPVDGMTLDADLTWRASALTVFGLNASTQVEETNLGSSGGAVVYRVGAGVDHALRRHFLFGIDARYTLRDFASSALTEETFYFAAGFTYQFHHDWALRAGYSFTRFDSSTPGSDYYTNAVTLGLLWQK